MHIFLIKLTVTPLLMLAVSLCARRWGSLIAGLLAGMPLTSGPISVYLAAEQGSRFAAHAATGALSGITAVLISYLCYLALTIRNTIVLACAGSLVVFVISAVIMMALDNNAAAVTVSVIAICLLIYSTQEAGARMSAGRLPKWDLLARLVASTAMVLAVTAFAAKLGPEVTGILSPIPVIAWPLVVFAHVQAGRPEVVSAVRGIAAGSAGIVVFCIAISQLLMSEKIITAYLIAFSASAVVSFAFGVALNQRSVRFG